MIFDTALITALLILVVTCAQLCGISLRAVLSLVTLRLSHSWKTHRDVLNRIHVQPQPFQNLVQTFEGTVHPVDLTTSIIRLEHLGLLERITDTPTSALIATRRGRQVLRIAHPAPSLTLDHHTNTEEYITTTRTGSSLY